MSKPLRLAVAGLGRMGWVHATHALEVARTTGHCELVALADTDRSRLERFAGENDCSPALFGSVADLASSGTCDATFVVTPTEKHPEHAAVLIRAGQRVLLEKPLTGTLAGDREFAGELDRDYPNALMIAFQRRFDAALSYARQLLHSGAIGRLFKVYSSLEDSSPAPNGYQSDGILPDMSIHNVDEILWLTGRKPTAALAIGSRLYSHALTTCAEDFDDALLCMWFGSDLLAQVQVSRNHVSGYRVETILFGQEGQIQIGHFVQQPEHVVVEAFGRRGRSEPITSKTFAGQPDRPGSPEFVARFANAYKAELGAFIDCCRSGTPFPVNHRDGLAAQEVIAAAMQNPITSAHATSVP